MTLIFKINDICLNTAISKKQKFKLHLTDLVFYINIKKEFCELKHLSNKVIIESNEIIIVTASEIIIKIFNILYCVAG